LLTQRNENEGSIAIVDEIEKDHDRVEEMMTRIDEMSFRASTSKVKLLK